MGATSLRDRRLQLGSGFAGALETGDDRLLLE